MRYKYINKHIYLASSSEDYELAMNKLCLRVAMTCRVAVLLTKEPFRMSLVVQDEHVDDYQLKRFVIILLPDLESLRDKLLDIQQWIYKPVLIVVDLFSLMKDAHETTTAIGSELTEPLMKRVTRCAACLIAYLNKREILLKRNPPIVYTDDKTMAMSSLLQTVTTQNDTPENVCAFTDLGKYDAVPMEAGPFNDTLSMILKRKSDSSTLNSTGSLLPSKFPKTSPSHVNRFGMTSVPVAAASPSPKPPASCLTPHNKNEVCSKYDSLKSYQVTVVESPLAKTASSSFCASQNVTEFSSKTTAPATPSPTHLSGGNKLTPKLRTFSKKNEILSKRYPSITLIPSSNQVTITKSSSESTLTEPTATTTDCNTTPHSNAYTKSLLNFILESTMDSKLEREPQQSAKKQIRTNKSPIDAVLIMPKNPEPMTRQQLDILIALYFYEQKPYYDFEKLKQRVFESQSIPLDKDQGCKEAKAMSDSNL